MEQASIFLERQEGGSWNLTFLGDTDMKEFLVALLWAVDVCKKAVEDKGNRVRYI